MSIHNNLAYKHRIVIPIDLVI